MKNVLISLVNFFVTDRVFYDIKVLQISRVRGCSYGGELARLNGLARLGEMIFIPRSHGILYLSSIKKFVMSLEKDCLIKYFFTIR